MEPHPQLMRSPHGSRLRESLAEVLHRLWGDGSLSRRQTSAVRVSLVRSDTTAAASSDGIIAQSRLMELAGVRQKAALRRHLRKACIPFRELNGRIFTTQAALDAAMVGREKNQKRGP